MVELFPFVTANKKIAAHSDTTVFVNKLWVNVKICTFAKE